MYDRAFCENNLRFLQKAPWQMLECIPYVTLDHTVYSTNNTLLPVLFKTCLKLTIKTLSMQDSLKQL